MCDIELQLLRNMLMNTVTFNAVGVKHLIAVTDKNSKSLVTHWLTALTVIVHSD